MNAVNAPGGGQALRQAAATAAAAAVQAGLPPGAHGAVDLVHAQLQPIGVQDRAPDELVGLGHGRGDGPGTGEYRHGQRGDRDLELGGQAPAIVCDDADLDLAMSTMRLELSRVEEVESDPPPEVQVAGAIGGLVVIRSLVWHAPEPSAERAALDAGLRAVIAGLDAAIATTDIRLDKTALIAPFAFLGPAYDDALRDAYLEIRGDDDVFEKRFPLLVLFRDSLYTTEPLRRRTNGHRSRLRNLP